MSLPLEKVIRGRRVARELRDSLRVRVEELRVAGVAPHLGVVLVGENPVSRNYIRQKQEACESIGVDFSLFELDEALGQEGLEREVAALSGREDLTSVIVQLPIAEHLDSFRLLDLVVPEKDPDCLTARNYGRFFRGDAYVVPPTPAGVMHLLEAYDVELRGARVAMIGAGRLVGRPLSHLMLEAGATVEVLTRSTPDISIHTREVDVVVAAAGSPWLVTAEMVREGAVVIDVGLSMVDGKLRGDVSPEAGEKARLISPVPGGVGPMTVAKLLENVVVLCEKRTSE